MFSPHPVLVLGHLHLPWAKFRTFIREQKVIYDTEVDGYWINWDNALLMDMLREQIDTGLANQRPSLSFLIRSTRSFESTDPRDKLFALLNLASDSFDILPNYNVSAVEVWIAAFKTLIRACTSLDGLFKEPLLVDSYNRPTWSELLPSWIVTSRRANQFSALLLQNHDRHDADVKHVVNSGEARYERLDSLMVDAVWVDTLSTVSLKAPTVHDVLCQSSAYGFGLNNSLFPVSHSDYVTPNIRCLLWTCVRHSLGDLLNLEPLAHDYQEHTHNKAILDNGKIDPNWITLCQGQSAKDLWRCACTLRDYPPNWLRKLLSLDSTKQYDSLEILELNYKVIITTRGFIVILPVSAIEGDTLCIVLGCTAALVLRPQPELRRHYKVIGTAYIYGVSHGQAVHPDLHRGDYFDMNLDDLIAKRLYKKAITTWEHLSIKRPKRITLI